MCLNSLVFVVGDHFNLIMTGLWFPCFAENKLKNCLEKKRTEEESLLV